MKLRNASFGAAALVLASAPLFGSGCGGSTVAGTRTTMPLPADEAALLEFAPTDAFFVGRLDVRALRASPTWELVTARLENANEDERVLANGTDRVYFAVGGVIQAPPIPPRMDENGEYRPRVGWESMAEGLQGRLPTGLLVVEGSAASLCRTLIDALAETHDAHGLHYGSKEGVTLAVRGENVCMVTFDPVFEHLLAHAGRPSGTARRLMTVARDGSMGIASMAFELSSPAFRGLLESIGPSEEDAGETSSTTDWGAIARGILAELTSGVTAVEWEVRSSGESFESIGRVQVTDADRGVMWREMSEMYVRMTDIIVTNTEIPESQAEHLHRMATSTRFEPQDDGYVVRSTVSADFVRSMFETAAGVAPMAGMEVAVAQNVYELVYSLNGDALDTISRVEARLADLGGLEPRDRANVLVALSRAYRYVGRFDDARSALTTQLADAANAGTLLPPTLHAELCELELELGRGAEALAAGTAGRDECIAGDVYCDVVATSLLACTALARASLGDVDEALTLLGRSSVPAGEEPGVIFGIARARVLARVGRMPEALTTVESICMGRPYLETCRDAAVVEAMLVARSAESVAALDEALTLIEARIAGAGTSNQQRGHEIELALASMRCDGASRVEGASPQTADTCAAALSATTEAYGESHPRTLVAALGVARAARARRDTAATTAALARIDGILPRLGPNAAERTERAALGGNAGRRQTR